MTDLAKDNFPFSLYMGCLTVRLAQAQNLCRVPDLSSPCCVIPSAIRSVFLRGMLFLKRLRSNRRIL